MLPASGIYRVGIRRILYRAPPAEPAGSGQVATENIPYCIIWTRLSVAIQEALEQTRYNKTAAARVLGVTFRSLRYRLERLGIE